MKPLFRIIVLSVLTLFAANLILSCSKSGTSIDGPPLPTRLVFGFENFNGSLPLTLDTLKYRNAAGNNYMVTDLQYFLSEVKIHRSDGEVYTIQSNKGIHYIDLRIASSLMWFPSDEIPPGHYDSVSCTFGLSAALNIPNSFPDPPERDMAWPDILGGGYHYMKMNLIWKNDSMVQTRPFNFHLGIGQIYKDSSMNTDSIIGFVQNFFIVEFPSSSFYIESGQTKYLKIRMDVNRWFEGNNIFDFAAWPNMMMQDEKAMQKAYLNGRSAFTLIQNDRK